MQEDKRISEAMTLTEAAAFIRVSEKTLGEMARTRHIPSRKVGREWRFLRSALEAWLAGESPDSVSSVAEPAIQYELPFAGFRDTAFTENHDRTLHRWVPWIAGFSGSFVAGVLEQAERKRHRLRVLDPFAGVGTTLIEALKHGNDAIGFEINPYAALACKAKVNAAQYDVGLLGVMLDRFEEYSEEKLCSPDGKIASVPPAGFVSRIPFFSPDVERQVLVCLDFIAEETTDWLRELFQVALGPSWSVFRTTPTSPVLAPG
jgi:excisionase family DNA binding protein